MDNLSKKELIKYVEQLKEEINKLNRNKKFGLVWENTHEELDLKPIVPLLSKDTDLSIGEYKEPLNYLIEGDNYHSLKVLQYTHKNKIDIIYIDPPYNTGKEFVYNDKIVDNEDNFRHSKWLSFMDKRLRLAKNLMSEVGVIFVSIDDNEQAQLKLLMDEIFGEHNHVTTMIWKQKSGGSNDSKTIVTETEYIHVYTLNSNVEFSRNKVDTIDYKLEDEYVKTRGRYKLEKLDRSSIRYSESLDFPIFSKEFNKNAYPSGCPVRNKVTKASWRWSREKVHWGIQNGFIEFKKNKNGEVTVYTKQYEHVDNNGNVIERSNPYRNFIDFVNNSKGRNELKEIFNGGVVFSYPKPIELIKYLIKTAPKQDDAIVLDFFAGSGSTGHAVMELNKEDGGNRSFILCTNNEVSEEKVRNYFITKGLLDKNTKSAFNKFKVANSELVNNFYQSDEYRELGIARSVTHERIKKVIQGYTTPNGKFIEGLGGNLGYYVTEEFSEVDVYGETRNYLAQLSLNSHCLRYPSNIYHNILVNTTTNLANLIIESNKIPTFLINARDNETLSQRIDEIVSKFGNNTIIHSIEDYYGEF